MSLSAMIFKLRSRANLSQEKFASMMEVSRQAVQKWENGSAQPDLANIIRISKFFGISIDALLLDSRLRAVEELELEKEIKPEYSQMFFWELYSSQLPVEYRQSFDEGLDVEALKALFEEAGSLPAGKNKERIADALFDMVLNAKPRKGYRYTEPSRLEEIHSLRPKGADEFPAAVPPRGVLEDKIRGAWLGRICGCLLGKPIEGIHTKELHSLLKASGNYPMHRYILSTDITDDMAMKYTFRLKGRCYPDAIGCMPADDDTNYTVLAQLLIEKYGREFTPYDVSRLWLSSQPKDAYCTAERVAFCNFVNGYIPPDSAVYKNPYREWIGAQIRADYYGYINPGRPKQAAEMAWRDASVSHVKNGIYGAMFVAAMLACAASEKDMKKIIRGGLAQIPATSRLYEAVGALLERAGNGVCAQDVFAAIHAQYNESDSYDWCHTISNALIVVAALLYGDGDFGKSVCMAVETGFDTDCNGATVGSILGMRNGAAAIGEEWTAPLHGTLQTSIFGVGDARIDSLIEKTLAHLDGGQG